MYHGKEFADCGEFTTFALQGTTLVLCGTAFVIREELVDCEIVRRTTGHSFCIMENHCCALGKDLWIVNNIRCNTGNHFRYAEHIQRSSPA